MASTKGVIGYYPILLTSIEGEIRYYHDASMEGEIGYFIDVSTECLIGHYPILGFIACIAWVF